ncbi:MAG TPA: oxidoreductase, partial [Anaeromyxobacteraceae bacterium]|nr:oxidoreductase [Anaeromyxobacteraceae bacterium]
MEHVIEMGGPGEEEALAAPLRKRVRTLDATVVEVVRETPDVVTLVLSTGRREAYAAGHFLTIDPHQFSCLSDLVAYFEDAKGRREPPRAYSIASSPLEPLLAVTVKEEHYLRGVTRYPPILSPYLVHRVQRGDRLKVVGFTGAYVLPPDLEAKADHLVHLVAGSGSVPNYSILKYALAKHPLLRHTFVYSSKTWSDVIFREGLAEIEKRHPDRVRVVHTLTRQGGPACGEGGVRTGRV